MQGIELVLLLVAVAVVAFWRAVIKLLVAVVLAIMGYGAIMIWLDMHHHIAG
jgi:hypothetical protein